jgi:hypothetical protein
LLHRLADGPFPEQWRADARFLLQDIEIWQ